MNTDDLLEFAINNRIWSVMDIIDRQFAMNLYFNRSSQVYPRDITKFIKD